jgi:Methyltransferase domain
VVAWLHEAGALRAGVRVLDAGSGDSYVAATVHAVAPGAPITCWDRYYTDDDLHDAASGTTRVREEPDGTFDVVLALDVIEHVADDVGYLRTLRSHAAAGATLVVTVPAYQRLFTSHDVYLGHYRRYSRRQLEAALAAGGWSVGTLTGFFFCLLPVRALAATLERRPMPDDGRGSSVRHLGTWGHGRVLTSLIERALAADAATARAFARRSRRGLPGLSVGAVARPDPAFS